MKGRHDDEKISCNGCRNGTVFRTCSGSSAGRLLWANDNHYAEPKRRICRPNGSSTTVESAKSLRDDTWVTLRGNIVERISDDLYVFKDATGTVNVDIDHKRWNGVTVTPQDVVEIQGEVDKDWNSVEIDVKQITKVAK